MLTRTHTFAHTHHCRACTAASHTRTAPASPAGFTSVEVFRKYLWFLLRERQFDEGALDDLVALKAALGLSDEEVGRGGRRRWWRWWWWWLGFHHGIRGSEAVV